MCEGSVLCSQRLGFSFLSCSPAFAHTHSTLRYKACWSNLRIQAMARHRASPPALPAAGPPAPPTTSTNPTTRSPCHPFRPSTTLSGRQRTSTIQTPTPTPTPDTTPHATSTTPSLEQTLPPRRPPISSRGQTPWPLQIPSSPCLPSTTATSASTRTPPPPKPCFQKGKPLSRSPGRRKNARSATTSTPTCLPTSQPI